MSDLNFEDLLNNMAHTENLPPPYNRYEGLKKPDWTPPDSVFGPMWATLYLLMSFAGTFKYSGGGYTHSYFILKFVFTVIVVIPISFATDFIIVIML